MFARSVTIRLKSNSIGEFNRTDLLQIGPDDVKDLPYSEWN